MSWRSQPRGSSEESQAKPAQRGRSFLGDVSNGFDGTLSPVDIKIAGNSAGADPHLTSLLAPHHRTGAWPAIASERLAANFERRAFEPQWGLMPSLVKAGDNSR